MALFDPVFLGKLPLANRLVRSATGERMCDLDGRPGQTMIDLYARLARGGVGLMVTGDAYVTRKGQISPHQLGIHSDALVDELKRVAEAVHREGGRIAVQINHAGRLALPQRQDGARPAAPSPVSTGAGRTPPRQLSDTEITEIVHAYGQAARRAKQAGFDGAQLHGAHGTSLISQFLSPHTNRRSDRWGGDFDRRLRFLLSVCETARSEVGTDFPLWIKLASQDFVRDGLTPEDGAGVAERLGDFGLDAVEISGGIQETGASRSVRPGIRSVADEGYFLANARRIRRVTDLPIVLVGGFRTMSVMERMVSDEGLEFVSLCRPLINDPELPKKMQSGDTRRSTCISCNLCLERSDEPLRCFYRHPK